MQREPKDRFQTYIKSVDGIITAMKEKERNVEEVNTEDFSSASQTIKEKLLAFKSLYNSAIDTNTQDKLTDQQKKIFEKVIEDANLGIESHSLKVIRDSIADLELFRERISNS